MILTLVGPYVNRTKTSRFQGHKEAAVLTY